MFWCRRMTTLWSHRILRPWYTTFNCFWLSYFYSYYLDKSVCAWPSSVAEKLRSRLCNQNIAGSNPASGHLATTLQKGDLSWILSASAIKLLQFTVVLLNIVLHKSFIHSFIHSLQPVLAWQNSRFVLQWNHWNHPPPPPLPERWSVTCCVGAGWIWLVQGIWHAPSRLIDLCVPLK